MTSYDLGYLVGQIGVLLACILLPLAVIGGVIWFAVTRSRRTPAPTAYHPTPGPPAYHPGPPAHRPYPPVHPTPPHQPDPYQQYPAHQPYPPSYDPYQPSAGDPSSYRSDPPQSWP